MGGINTCRLYISHDSRILIHEILHRYSHNTLHIIYACACQEQVVVSKFVTSVSLQYGYQSDMNQIHAERAL